MKAYDGWIFTKFATGPRNDNYGYGEGVITLDAAKKYDGRSVDDAMWADLEAEDWNFDQDEDEYRYDQNYSQWRSISPRALYIDGDTIRLEKERT